MKVTCFDCNVAYERKKPRPCRDGILRCKKCHSKITCLESYHKHKNAPGKREARKARTKAWQKANPEKKLAINRRSRYGLSEEVYKAMVNNQNGKCAICKIQSIRDVNHCHVSGKIRGLLCQKCNLMLGYSNDNPEILRVGADYLETK